MVSLAIEVVMMFWGTSVDGDVGRVLVVCRWLCGDACSGGLGLPRRVLVLDDERAKLWWQIRRRATRRSLDEYLDLAWQEYCFKSLNDDPTIAISPTLDGVSTVPRDINGLIS